MALIDPANDTSDLAFDLLTPLEPRLVFDGAAASDAFDSLVVTDIDLADIGYDDNELDFTDGLALVAERDITADRREVIFVDASIANLTNILGQLPDTAEIQLVDSSTDGIAAIANWASTQTNIDAIHIISHGAQGELYLGSSVLSNDTIAAVGAELTTLGGALTETGDILLYGCNIADGAAGLDFIERFAQATSADVAASSDDTGTAVLGGDWDLEVQTGDVDADIIGVIQYNAILSASQFIENGSAIVVDSGYTFTDSGDYSGGTIKYTVASSSSTETLSLLKVSSPITTTGEISIVGSNVYLGEGGGSAKVIGSVDGTNNGLSGKPLQINLKVGFTNPSFDDTSAQTLSSTTNVIDGWTIVNQRISISAGNKIDGLTIPQDTSWPSPIYPSNSDNGNLDSQSWYSAVVTESGRGSVIRMTSGLNSSSGYEVMRGPYIYSNDTTTLSTGDTVKFDWKAEGGSDAYDVFGYIINRDNPADYQIILNGTGANASASTSWGTETVTVNSAGNYQFVFISGSWDASGGEALGAQLFIDNVQVTQANATTLSGADIAQITAKLTYANSSEAISVSGLSRSIAADYTRGNGTFPGVQTLNFSELGINDAPVLGGTTFNLTTISEDDSTNAGQLVSTIVGTAITDVDASPVEGIAITSLTESAGTGVWQYQLSGSSTWVTVGAVDATSALLLGANDKIRFLPDEAFGGTASFTFNAWDQTSGTAGSKVAIGSTGGTTAFSTASKTANITVTSIDDAPVLTASATGTEMLTGTARAIAPGLTITDVDSTTLSGAKVSVSNLKSGDVLAVSGTLPTGITASYSASTGVLTLSGSASLADYQAALRAVTFDTTSTDTTDRTFDFSLGEALAFSGNGHYYEFVSASGIEWADAKAAAEARTFLGMQGYLVTVTSAEENAFVASKLAGEGWMGASDATTEDAWYWVTGPEAGTQFWQGASTGTVVGGEYNNWASGEPNDSGSNEDHAHFLSGGTWNDYRYNNPNIDGYVVEYGTSTSGSGVASLKSVVSTVTRAVLTNTAIEWGTARDGAEATGNALVDNLDGSSLIFKVSQVKKDGGTYGSVAANSTSSTNPTEVTGLYGTLKIGENGSYTYDPTDYLGDVQALNTGEQLTDSFILNVVDANGAVAERTLVMTIDGTNDAPVAIDATASVNEDAATNISGTLTSNDVDNTNAERTYTLDAPVAGLTLATDGSWTFDASDDAYQYLQAGETLNVVANFTVEDAETATDSGTLTITVTGVNDAPVFGTVTGLTSTGGTSGSSTGDLVSVFEVTDDPAATPLALDGGQTVNIGLYTANARGTSQLSFLSTFYNNEAGMTASNIATSFDGTAPSYDLIVVFQPTSLMTDNEISSLTLFVNNGGRVFFIGEHNGYAPAENANISDAITRLGGAITVLGGSYGANDFDDGTVGLKNINNSPLMAGVTSFKTAAWAQLQIDASISQAVLVADSASSVDNRITIADQAVGMGRVTLIADQNWLDDSYRIAGNETFLRNLAINSVQNVAVVSGGGNPNDGFGAGAGFDETNAPLVEGGTIAVSDVDLLDEVTATVTSVSAVFDDGTVVDLATAMPSVFTAGQGMFTISPADPVILIDDTETTDDLTWTFDSGTETFDFLAQGEKITFTYTITVTDSQGATATQDVDITINGTNDAPVVEEIIPETVSVTGAQIAYPTAYAFSDIDASDVLVYSASGLPPGMTIDSSTGIISGSSVVPDDYSVVITATDPFGGTVDTAPFILKVVSPPAPPIPLPPANDGPPAGPADIFTPEVTTDTVLNMTDPGKGLAKTTGEQGGGVIPAAGGSVGIVSAATLSTDSIAVARPFPDMGVTSGPVGFIIPRDTFITTALSLSLSASLADGSSLPDWLEFNAETGEFSGTPPEGYEGELDLMVKARDSNGAEALTTFTLTVGNLTDQDAKLDILDWDSIEADFASVETNKAVKGAAALSQALMSTRIGVGTVSIDTVITAG